MIPTRYGTDWDNTHWLYCIQAEVMVSKKKYREAEKLYITVKEPDLAINMSVCVGRLVC